MIEVHLRSGERALVATIEASDPYEAALVWLEAQGFARHQATLEAYRPNVLVFSVTPLWSRALPAAPPLPEIGDLKAWLKGMAHALGFALVGVTHPKLPQRYYDRFTEWTAAGGHGGMSFLERSADKRVDPKRVSPTAQSVIAVATPYSPVRPGRIARYATGRDYHQVLATRLDLMKRLIYREFPGSRLYSSVDTGPVLERAYAEQAGIGWIGKNGMLISRTHGSYLSLATLWTPFVLEADTPYAEYCGSCTSCLSGCPTQAITSPGWVEAKRCIAYWTIEHTGDIPVDAPGPHGWLFGCDVCQEVCPWNRFASPVSIDTLHARPETLHDWLSASDAQIEERMQGTPVRRVGVAGMRRNARRLLNVID